MQARLPGQGYIFTPEEGASQQERNQRDRGAKFQAHQVHDIEGGKQGRPRDGQGADGREATGGAHASGAGAMATADEGARTADCSHGVLKGDHCIDARPSRKRGAFVVCLEDEQGCAGAKLAQPHGWRYLQLERPAVSREAPSPEGLWALCSGGDI